MYVLLMPNQQYNRNVKVVKEFLEKLKNVVYL